MPLLMPRQARAALVRIAASMEIANLLNEIENSTSRISDLVRAIKEYTYMDQSPVQNVDIVKSLETTLTILNHKLKRGVTVQRDYQRVPFLVNSFGSELNQVWTNIIDNAIDAMGGQGELRVRTYREDACVVVEIADNGPGIPDKVLPHIFEPFFTTKGVGQGTGLGLDTASAHRAQASRADSGELKAGRNALSDMASAGGSPFQLAFGFGGCVFNFRVAKAGHQMIIHHSHCLHERVTDCRADKFESSFEQVAAHLVGFLCSRLYLGWCAERIDDWLPPTNCQMYASKEPNSFCTARNARAFCTVDDIFSRLRTMPAFSHQLLQLCRIVACNAFRIEVAESPPISFALGQNG